MLLLAVLVMMHFAVCHLKCNLMGVQKQKKDKKVELHINQFGHDVGMADNIHQGRDNTNNSSAPAKDNAENYYKP